MLVPQLSYNFTCQPLTLLWLGDPSPVRRWPAGWSDGHVTTDVSLALPWLVVGSDVLRSGTVCREKSVLNRRSYEVGVRRSACWGGSRCVCDNAILILNLPDLD